MNLEKTIKNINRSLNKKQPTSFNSVWIKLISPGYTEPVGIWKINA